MPLASPFPPEIAFCDLAEATEGAAPPHPEEVAALGPATSARRHAQFALGRACARAALAALGEEGAVAIGRVEGRQPAWPPGIVGSITHSHEHAAAAVAHAARYQGIGVDLERLRLPRPELLRRICRPAERAALEALPEGVLPTAFTALFATKECIYKALHPLTGIYLGFQDAELALDGADWAADAGRLTWTLHKDSGARFPAGFTGSAAWRKSDPWMLAGVWIPA